MDSAIERVLLNEEEINKRVSEIAVEIKNDFPNGDLILIGVLKGSVIFVADLMRAMNFNVTMDFMAQVQSFLMTHQYESLLKKANFKGGLSR